MNGHQPSLYSSHPALHMLAPSMPARDREDVRMRVLNFRKSMNTCPTYWRQYFQVLASEMEREVN